jgi:serine phosphatase RsbU (regulator of sigma subunit)
MLMTGTCLGIADSNESRISEYSLSVAENDVIILQSDGLMDSTNESNVPFDHVKSQKNFIAEINKERSAQQILDAITKKVEIHIGLDKSFDDDATIVVLKIAKD